MQHGSAPAVTQRTIRECTIRERAAGGVRPSGIAGHGAVGGDPADTVAPGNSAVRDSSGTIGA